MNVFIHPWTLGNLTVKYLSINSNYPWNLSHGRNVASTISAVSNKKCYRLSYCKFSLLDISMQINHAKFLSFLEKYYGIFSTWTRISQSKYLTIIWKRSLIPFLELQYVSLFAHLHLCMVLRSPPWNYLHLVGNLTISSIL